jgi:diguanylate cyclase (GGDEF)-like protein
MSKAELMDETFKKELTPEAFGLEHPATEVSRPQKEEVHQRKLDVSGDRDDLTGLYDRDGFFRKLEQETERARRQGRPLSLIILDVGGFREFNQRYGRLRGNDLLRTVAELLQWSAEEYVDCVFRTGADEFAVMLPEAGGKTALSIWNMIKARFKDIAPTGTTLSMGAAVFQNHFDVETFVHLTTKRLDVNKSISKELIQHELEGEVGKGNGSIRCLSCGSFVHWASSTCEGCLSDPMRDPRETPRISFRKTFIHDDLLARIQNISQGGIQLKTRTSLSIGDLVRIALYVEDGIVRLCGTVVYARSLSAGDLLAGIKFYRLCPKDSELWKRFLCARSLDGPSPDYS